MALGSGSSFSTDCSMRRRGSPASHQLLRAGLASRLHQVSSKKPTTHSGRPSDRRINRSLASLAFFSLVLRIWGSDPALGPLPAHSQARQCSPDGLAGYLLLREALFEAHLCSEIQRPHTRVFAELPGFVVQKLPQGLGLLGILEGPMNGMRTFRALPKYLRKSLLVEGVYGVAGSLRIASQLVSDLAGIFASGAGEQDLAAAQGEGIRRTQACLQGLALGVTQGMHKDRSFHTSEDKP